MSDLFRVLLEAANQGAQPDALREWQLARRSAVIEASAGQALVAKQERAFVGGAPSDAASSSSSSSSPSPSNTTAVTVVPIPPIPYGKCHTWIIPRTAIVNRIQVGCRNVDTMLALRVSYEMTDRHGGTACLSSISNLFVKCQLSQSVEIRNGVMWVDIWDMFSQPFDVGAMTEWQLSIVLENRDRPDLEILFEVQSSPRLIGAQIARAGLAATEPGTQLAVSPQGPSLHPQTRDPDDKKDPESQCADVMIQTDHAQTLMISSFAPNTWVLQHLRGLNCSVLYLHANDYSDCIESVELECHGIQHHYSMNTCAVIVPRHAAPSPDISPDIFRDVVQEKVQAAHMAHMAQTSTELIGYLPAELGSIGSIYSSPVNEPYRQLYVIDFSAEHKTGATQCREKESYKFGVVPELSLNTHRIDAIHMRIYFKPGIQRESFTVGTYSLNMFRIKNGVGSFRFI